MPTYVTGLDKDTGQGERAVVHYTTGCQAVDLEVDLETGKLDILKAVSAFDVGKAINPELVKGQMEGGFVMGMSTGYFEAMRLKGGVMQNPSFVDYRIATSTDVPQKVESIIVEVAQDDGPWGARGIGEHSMVPTVPAIANAIFDAIKIRVGRSSLQCGESLPGHGGCRDRKIIVQPVPGFPGTGFYCSITLA